MAASREKVFRELFRSYYPVILTAAFNRLNNVEDAEDAAAEVFRIVWSRAGEQQEELNIKRLYRTLRNVVGNEYRHRERSRRRMEKAERLIEESYTDDRSEIADTRRLIASMKPEDRELIWMAYWEELTREEMAEILGCSLGTVRVRLHRARLRFKELVERSSTHERKER